jgi:glycosyltransferase involved in cell wall biosynthesis
MVNDAVILVDAREFVAERMTGIGRMLSGLVDALSETPWVKKILLAGNPETIPDILKGSPVITLVELPKGFFLAERELSRLTKRGCDLFVSPYPKLPSWRLYCPSVHTIHDVLDLSFSSYERKLKAILDRQRLKWAMRNASLTWYDSHWSMEETRALIGTTGQNPKVRHLAVDPRFREKKSLQDESVLNKYGLKEGYILVVGNGLPHKNLGVLLPIAESSHRTLLLVGVSKRNRCYWEAFDQTGRTLWIETVNDEEMPAILRGAFCLAQPSLIEGYGYPPLEAMACGTPAVISHIPVLLETTGGNALVADPSDSQSWLAAFERLEDNDLRHEQISKGFGWIANLQGKAGWMHHVADMEELIRRFQ